MRIGLYFMLVLAFLCSCSKPPSDPLCSSEPLPDGSNFAAGDGALQIIAPGQDYFAVNDSAGKQIKNAPLNSAVDLKPGSYTAKINGSTHPITAQSKMLTRCTASAVRVTGDTDEYYNVH